VIHGLSAGAAVLLGSRRPPASLVVAGLLVGAAAVLPAAYLAGVVGSDPSAALDDVLTSETAAVAARSLGLTAAVCLTAVALALPLAWLTTRTDLPGRRTWATLAALPLVIPSYVGAYLLIATIGPSGLLQDALGVERLPSIYGFAGAWLSLTLFTFPLVLLPLRAALRRLDPQLEDAARAMGRTPAETFRTVVMPQLWPALAAGSLLVALYVMSDFGAVSIMRFDSFTVELYVAYRSSFDRTATAALAAVLVVVMLLLLWLSSGISRSRAVHRQGPGAPRPPRPYALGRWKLPAIVFCSLVVGIALVLPVGVLIYWATKGISAGAVTGEVAAALAQNSLMTAGLAAAVGGACALVVAILAGRFRSPVSRMIERFGHAGYALPGVVVALSLVYFATRAMPSVYQTVTLLVFALAIHYLPLAIGPIGAALAQVSPRVEEAARSLGRRPIDVFRTITAPLVRGGILAGTALVFLHAIKELPATLILAPTGFETLATEIWEQTSFGFYEASAIPALILVAIAAPPLYLLSERGTVAA
jgi:iron(III) transport system permease protein